MVVFTCGHCGESLQKPKVEKHYMTKCRNRNPNLSCMDCFKDFFGNDYEAHTKCITEEQRYSGKGFVAKEKKGEQKQNTWIELVQSVLDEQLNAPPNVRKIITAISSHTNTPRKKPKFINFVKNICGNKTNPKDIDAAWDLIAVKLSALSINNQNRNQNGDVNEKKEQENSTVDDENNVSSSSDSSPTNGESEKIEKDVVNGENENDSAPSGKERKSKKQLKAEKKQKKYEAELQKAAQAPEEDLDEEEEEKEHKNKKDKKKNKVDSTTNDEDVDTKNKKKRKRLDTTNSVTAEPVSNGANELSVENLKINGEKTKKKKPKINKNEEEEEEEEAACLHDQNVANTNTEEHEFTSDKKFNWHAVIFSVLEKKGNEMPFKRLQKKVLSQYSEDTGREVDDRIADKFIKKLRSAPNVKVDKNTVYIED